MKYYEMHEVVYQKLKEEGFISWDRSTTFEGMWSHSTIAYLEKFLSKLNLGFSNLTVLDLGTGTGTSALFAAKNGAKVTGVEISASAIELARRNAHALGVSIEFLVGDVLDLNLSRKLDLIIDSTILHCLVGAKDRKKFFDTVKCHMHASSYFFVNTMIASENMDLRFPKDFFLFQNDILWSLGMNQVADRKIINGKSYFPHRTLLDEKRQLEEFKNHGFEVVEMEKFYGADLGYDLLALLKSS